MAIAMSKSRRGQPILYTCPECGVLVEDTGNTVRHPSERETSIPCNFASQSWSKPEFFAMVRAGRESEPAADD